MKAPPRRARWAATIAARLLVLQLLLGLAACSSDKPPPIAGLFSDGKVVAFGDSLTAGVGASVAQAYPAQLAAMIGRPVVNAGVSGETSGEGRARLPGVLDREQPQLVILCEGGNDMLRQMDQNAMAENLAAMISEIRGRGMAVVLVAVPMPKLLHLSPAPIYAELGKRFAVPVENAIMARVLADRSRKSDEIHPNPQGYHEIAEAIAALLKRAGAI
jgi:acyl-CoA thioesterase-1